MGHSHDRRKIKEIKREVRNRTQQMTSEALNVEIITEHRETGDEIKLNSCRRGVADTHVKVVLIFCRVRGVEGKVAFGCLRRLRESAVAGNTGIPDGGHAADRPVAMKTGVADDIIIKGGGVSYVVIGTQSKSDEGRS